MKIKIVLVVLFLNMIFLGNCFANNEILNVSTEKWKSNLDFLKIENTEEFLIELKKEITTFENKINSQNFKQINSKDTKKENNLLLFKQKSKSKFFIKLELDNLEFNNLFKLLQLLKTNNCNNKEIIKLMPYLTYAFNNKIPFLELEYEIKNNINNTTPIDVVKERLLFLVKNRAC